MSEEKEITKVIFRFWKGEVIAIFPELYGNSRYTCESYMHFGQHGACAAHYIIDHSRPAKSHEYAELAAELYEIGYLLDVRQRFTYAMDSTRYDNWARDCAAWNSVRK